MRQILSDFARFFCSCILAPLVIFRDIICVHIVENAFFDAFWSLCDLEIIEIRLKFFDLFWTIVVIVVFVRNWIKFIIWFNFWFNCEWIFSFFHRPFFRYTFRCFVNLFFRDCASRSRYATFAFFCALCATFAFCISTSTSCCCAWFEFEFKFMKFLHWFSCFKIFWIDAFWFEFAKFNA